MTQVQRDDQCGAWLNENYKHDAFPLRGCHGPLVKSYNRLVAWPDTESEWNIYSGPIFRIGACTLGYTLHSIV